MIPAAPTGLSATAVSSSGINLAWTASSGATTYNLLRSTTGGGPYTTVATGIAATTYGDSGLSASTTYDYVVQAVNSAGTSPNSNEASATTQAQVSLALTQQDIGTVSPAGSASYSGGTYTLNTGSGSALMVSSTSDNFSYDYQSMTGDGSMTARVASLSCGDTIKCEGALMMRETLGSGSAYAAVGVTTGRGTQFSYRTSTGASSASSAGPNQKAPSWVRLTRSGSAFTAYTSVDGSTWTQLGSPQTIPMASSVYVGFALSNHGGTGSATMDNVTAP